MNQTANNQILIEKQVLAFAEAWNKHDAKALSELYAEDGDFVDFMGHWLRGRQAVEQAHEAIFKTVMRQSRETLSEINTRFIKPDVAVVHCVWMLEGQLNPHGETVPPRRGRLLIIVQQNGEKWQIVSSQNTELFEQPHFK